MKTFSGRKASQNEFELRSFIQFLKDSNVRRYMEIGARHGDTFHEVMKNLPKSSYGLAMDLPGGLWGTPKSKDHLARSVKDLNANGYDCEYLYADSQLSETAFSISSMLPFDAILIDGDHTLEGVTKDWNNYKDRAEIIAFHDIVGTGEAEKVNGNLVEVPILWAEIKTQYKTLEFIDTNSKMGIGVCFPLSLL